MRASDTLARLGGDEFVAILGDLSNHTAVARIIRSFEEALAEPIVIDNQPVELSVSIGVAIYPEDTTDIAEMQKLADRRMYIGKCADRPAPG